MTTTTEAQPLDMTKAVRGKYFEQVTGDKLPTSPANGKDYTTRSTKTGSLACEVAASAIANVLQSEQCSFDKATFHKLCDAYTVSQALKDSASDAFELRKKELQLFVDQFGYVPTGADKTTRCATERYQADIQRATPVEINDSRVEDFQTICRKARIASLFPFIFQRRVEYTLVPKADKVIETAPVPKKYALAFHSLYALCFTPKPKSPSLKVIDLTEEQAAQQKKAEEKAAKTVAAKEAKTAAKAEKKGGASK
jgi:hypothetical protein